MTAALFPGDEVSETEHHAAVRRGELHAALCDLIEQHGLEDVIDLLRVAAEDSGHEVALDPAEVIVFPRKCGCGRVVQDREAWDQLPYRGQNDELVFRNCPCGSTMTIRVLP